ncbi:MAG: DUF1289 domain-containing protein [Rhodospirillaceae bacterium]|nr:DUF1289 domain-containing protein [Rhodospirillaceae bacterium]
MDQDFPITSPCVGVCQINAKTKFCLGCFRTLREVAHWSRYSDDQKAEVMQSLRERQSDAGVDRRRVTRRQRRRTTEAEAG